MKTLVTGGCGFIGSRLVSCLKELGHNVIVIDDLSSEGSSYSLTMDYHILDIRNYDDIEPLFEGVGCVFHLAAEARIQASIDDPKRATDINTFGTMNILEACRKHGVKRLVNSSTSAVYGLTEQFPTNEDTKTDCLNPYAASKLAAEEMIRCYSKVYGLESYNLRYFNVFGEDSPVHGPYSLVVGLFLDQRENNKSLTVVGDGSSLRDFVYIGDVVDANIRAMIQSYAGQSEILNIGSGQNISVLEIAKSISDNIIFVPPRVGEAKTTLADVSHVKEVLGWEPKIMLLDWLS